jgi:hypothetical protein
MKTWKYFRYFFFLAWNWSPSLAWFILRHEIRGEKKYGLDTTGADELGQLKKKGIDISHASMYMPLNYFILESLMEKISSYKGNGTLLDLGCGKGRVMAVAASYGFTNISGVDFSRALCEDAERTMANCREKFPGVRFSIINNDAFYYEIPRDVTTIFLFNPFDEVITSGVAANVAKSLREYPRTLRIVYANPLYKSLFTEQGFVQLYHIKKFEYLEGMILEKTV